MPGNVARLKAACSAAALVRWQALGCARSKAEPHEAFEVHKHSQKSTQSSIFVMFSEDFPLGVLFLGFVKTIFKTEQVEC